MKTPTINSRILKLEVLKGTATRTSVNAVESRTTSLESDVATAQGDISTLQGDVVTLTQEIQDAVSPLTTAGDLLYGGTSGTPTRLGIGTSGQVLSVSSGGLPTWSDISGTGTVTSITAGTGLTGGTITGSGTIGLDASGVTAGSYGSASAVPVLTVDATGRITAASTAEVSGSGGSGTGDVTGPSSSVSGRLAVFSGTTGKAIADSSTITAAGGALAVPTSLGVGTATPVGQIEVVSMKTVSVRGQVVSQHTPDRAAALIIGRKSRGTAISPTSISGGDYLFVCHARGYLGGSWLTLGNFGYKTTSISGGNVAGGWFFSAAATNDEDPTTAGTVGLEVLSNKVVSCPWTTASTSPTTGALIISGGAGIAGRTSTGSLSISTTGTACDGLWSATATLDFGSIAAASQADLTITVTGASVGDSVQLGLPAAPTAGLVFTGWVSAANTVTIRATNITATAIAPASATYRATVFSF